MIAKAKMNVSIGGSIGYCSKGEKQEISEVLMSNGCTEKMDAKLLTAQFELQASQRKEAKGKIMHIIISHSPKDNEKIQGKEKAIIKDWISELAKSKGKNEGLDLSNTQYVVFKHKDKEHTHYHLLVNMVDNNGKRLKDNNIGLKAKATSMEITKKYDLTKAISPEREAKQMAKQVEMLAKTAKMAINPLSAVAEVAISPLKKTIKQDFGFGY